MLPEADGGWRIIPARAGFTLADEAEYQWRWDHPRSRGVYVDAGPRSGLVVGSSPLARGLLYSSQNSSVRPRIIPARAGFTTAGRLGFMSTKDHPRSRGVYCGAISITLDTGGSSPLARGLLMRLILARARGGIIPARAGFTPTHREWPRAAEDHPRSRGVYVASAGFLSTQTGSSPLARGLPT